MHPVGADGERHVDPVVEDDRNAHCPQERPARDGQVSRRSGLEPELYRGDAPLLRCADQAHQIPPTDKCVVSNEHELQCLR
jgi:hypothetical protein